MSNPEEYLKKNVKDILQPLLKKILDERPSEPVTNKNKLIFFLNYNLYYFFLIDPFYDKISPTRI